MIPGAQPVAAQEFQKDSSSHLQLIDILEQA
nr:MAG TPA: hypothetical protein [Caudoviricetes sp.]